jgi:two-component system sensor histidine kinase PilS (NtrC family)
MNDAILEQRLKRLMLFRVVMITTLLLIAISVEAVSETLAPVNPLYFLIAGTYGLTILYVLAFRLRVSPQAQVYIQVVADLFTITGLVYLTGGTGTRAGFMLLYPISVLSGSVLSYRRTGLLLAGVAGLLYAGLFTAVRLGVIPAGAGLADVAGMPAKQIAYSVFVTTVACVTVALIGSYLSESLRVVGAQLEEASEEAAELRELNQVIVNSLQSGLLITDPEGRVLYVNHFGETILDRPLGLVRGHTVREIFGSWLLDGGALQARARARELARLELTYQRPDGTVLDLGISVSPLATSDPDAGACLLSFQDLTEIKRLEREVHIKEKLAAVGEMAAQLAHEIRNPLGSISGSAQVLLGEPNISADQEQLLRIITKESRRLSDTLNQFLFQARPSLPGAAGPVDLGRVLEEAFTLLRNGTEVKPGHQVSFDLQGGPHICVADPDQITQVFWNLARNGLEAMPDGGVLSVSLSTRGPDVVLRVCDQGRGMRHEEQRQLFEPFQSRSPMGTGLGLAIVYRIVREHKGDIGIRSVPGQGTEVEVRLPRVSVRHPRLAAVGQSQ